MAANPDVSAWNCLEAFHCRLDLVCLASRFQYPGMKSPPPSGSSFLRFQRGGIGANLGGALAGRLRDVRRGRRNSSVRDEARNKRHQDNGTETAHWFTLRCL
jgi:hypothetical protein